MIYQEIKFDIAKIIQPAMKSSYLQFIKVPFEKKRFPLLSFCFLTLGGILTPNLFGVFWARDGRFSNKLDLLIYKIIFFHGWNEFHGHGKSASISESAFLAYHEIDLGIREEINQHGNRKINN